MALYCANLSFTATDMLSRRPPKPAPAFGLHISVRNPWYRASSALARPFPGQTRAHGATNPAKNATFSAPFAQNEGKCCISCNNLEAIGFKTGNIARNVAQNTTLSRECGLFPRFCCTKYNICYHDPGPPAHFHPSDGAAPAAWASILKIALGTPRPFSSSDGAVRRHGRLS